uniref:CRAL/TRIO N-terminal domain-containing protein n=1 Tax=Leersia perrieri TaxID=77586 RepID=A0A0D9V1R1_9ORYZ
MTSFLRRAATIVAALSVEKPWKNLVRISRRPSPPHSTAAAAARGHLALVRAHPGLRDLNAALTSNDAFFLDAAHAAAASAIRARTVTGKILRETDYKGLSKNMAAAAEHRGDTLTRPALLALLRARDGHFEEALADLARLVGETPGDPHLRLAAAALCYLHGHPLTAREWIASIPHDRVPVQRWVYEVAVVLAMPGSSPPSPQQGVDGNVMYLAIRLAEAQVLSGLQKGEWSMVEKLLVSLAIRMLRRFVSKYLRSGKYPPVSRSMVGGNGRPITGNYTLVDCSQAILAAVLGTRPLCGVRLREVCSVAERALADAEAKRDAAAAVDVNLFLAFLAARDGRFDEALRRYEAAARKDPADSRPYELADVLCCMCGFSKGQNEWRRSRQKPGSATRAHAGLPALRDQLMVAAALGHGNLTTSDPHCGLVSVAAGREVDAWLAAAPPHLGLNSMDRFTFRMLRAGLQIWMDNVNPQLKSCLQGVGTATDVETTAVQEEKEAKQEETLQHLFFTCPFAQACWDAICPTRLTTLLVQESIEDMQQKLQLTKSRRVNNGTVRRWRWGAKVYGNRNHPHPSMSRFLRRAALAAALAGTAAVALSKAAERWGISGRLSNPLSPPHATATRGHLGLVRAHPELRNLNAVFTGSDAFFLDAAHAFAAGALRAPTITGMLLRRSDDLPKDLTAAESPAVLQAREGRFDEALAELARLAGDSPGDPRPKVAAAALCFLHGRSDTAKEWLKDPPNLKATGLGWTYALNIVVAMPGSSPPSTQGEIDGKVICQAARLTEATLLESLKNDEWSIPQLLAILLLVRALGPVVSRYKRFGCEPVTMPSSSPPPSPRPRGSTITGNFVLVECSQAILASLLRARPLCGERLRDARAVAERALLDAEANGDVPAAVDVNLVLAFLASRDGDFDEALLRYKEAVRKDGSDSRAYELAAMLCLVNRRTAELDDWLRERKQKSHARNGHAVFAEMAERHLVFEIMVAAALGSGDLTASVGLQWPLVLLAAWWEVDAWLAEALVDKDLTLLERYQIRLLRAWIQAWLRKKTKPLLEIAKTFGLKNSARFNHRGISGRFSNPSSPPHATATRGHLGLVRAHPGLRDLNAAFSSSIREAFFLDVAHALANTALRAPTITGAAVRGLEARYSKDAAEAESTGDKDAAARDRIQLALLRAREGRFDEALADLARLAGEFHSNPLPRVAATALCFLHGHGRPWAAAEWIRSISSISNDTPLLLRELELSIARAMPGSSPASVAEGIDRDRLVMCFSASLAEDMLLHTDFTSGDGEWFALEKGEISLIFGLLRRHCRCPPASCKRMKGGHTSDHQRAIIPVECSQAILAELLRARPLCGERLRVARNVAERALLDAEADGDDLAAVDVNLLLAFLATRDGDFDEALRRYEEAERKDPSDPRPRELAAMLRFIVTGNRQDRAAALLDELVVAAALGSGVVTSLGRRGQGEHVLLASWRKVDAGLAAALVDRDLGLAERCQVRLLRAWLHKPLLLDIVANQRLENSARP